MYTPYSSVYFAMIYASRAASAVTLLSCVDSRNRFAAALSSATLYSIARRPQRVFRMCSYL